MDLMRDFIVKSIEQSGLHNLLEDLDSRLTGPYIAVVFPGAWSSRSQEEVPKLVYTVACFARSVKDMIELAKIFNLLDNRLKLFFVCHKIHLVQEQHFRQSLHGQSFPVKFFQIFVDSFFQKYLFFL